MDDETPNWDTMIVAQIENKERWQKEINAIDKLIALGTATEKDKIIKKDAELKVKDASDAIADITRKRKEYESIEKKEEDRKTLDEEKIEILKLIDTHHIGYITKENRYIYCIDMADEKYDTINPKFDYVEASKFGHVLQKMAGPKCPLRYATKMFVEDLIDYFQDLQKDYFDITASFNNKKWKENKVYNKAEIISKYWLDFKFGNVDNCNFYDYRFDFLMHCIGGGKEENINHLEQWILFKKIFPHKVGNIPNLDLCGFPGGNGKGRYIELCKTIFTNQCVIKAARDELDKFNANWEMAVIVYYDEPDEKELSPGKIKTATGGEEIRIEKKGIDATMADRNYSMIFTSNNPEGVVRLSGTGRSGEDRRFSVISTDKVMVDEAMRQFGFSINEAIEFVDGINDLVKERTQVARWLGNIFCKHMMGAVNVLHPLHGDDYKARFNDQKDVLTDIFDLILPIAQTNGCLPYEILKSVVLALTGWEKLSDKKLKTEWKRYLEKNKITFTFYDAKSRVYFDYHWKGTNNVTVMKSIYILRDTYDFDVETILVKEPFDLRKTKDDCAVKEILRISIG